jgi:hypothetical protein
MKKLALLFCFTLLIVACQQEQRYFTNAPEIETAKKSIQAYDDGNWDIWIEKYTDSAKIFHNNWDESKSSLEVLASHKAMLANFPTYEFLDEPAFFEMTVNDEGQKWVNFWGIWQGISTDGNELKIPVHITYLYVNGKVVEEYGFWDTNSLMITMDEIVESNNELETVAFEELKK